MMLIIDAGEESPWVTSATVVLQVTDSACQGAAGGRLQQDSLQASPSQFVIDVDLKSITAVVPPQAAAIGSRMISR